MMFDRSTERGGQGPSPFEYTTIALISYLGKSPCKSPFLTPAEYVWKNDADLLCRGVYCGRILVFVFGMFAWKESMNE